MFLILITKKNVLICH